MTCCHPSSRFARGTMRRASCLLPTTFCFLFFAFCLLPNAFSQSATATLSGTVVDENGAVVPAVSVTLLNDATSLKRETVSNESGSFSVVLLPPGTYRLMGRHDGFKIVEIRDIVLNVGDVLSIRIQMKVGNVTETVNITNETFLIDDSPAVGTTVDRTFVENLPLNGRSFQSLIALTPGVVLTKTAQATPGQFSVNGQRSNANYFTIDGVSANASVGTSITNTQTAGGTVPALSALGGTNNLLSIDAMQEFKIQTSSYAAEFGRSPGAQVQIASRSGTNDVHGTLFDYLRNEKLDANDWFANRSGFARPALRQNDFGGTISGPVFIPRFGEGGPGWYDGKNKTFFFFSYEGLRLLQPRFLADAVVPSLSLRTSAPAALRPYLNAFAIPNGRDLGNGTALFSSGFSNPSTLDATSIRVDQNFGTKVTVFGRYNISPSQTTTRAISQFTSPFSTILDTETLTIGSTQIFSSGLNNDLRFNYSRNTGASVQKMDHFGGAVPVPDSLLMSPGFSSDTSLGQWFLTIGSTFGISTGSTGNNVQKQINLVDSLAFTIGSHQLKVGVDYRRLALLYRPNQTLMQVVFANLNAINTSVASQVLITAYQTARPIQTNFSAFAQETWKATPRLTLTYGVRWEIVPPPAAADGRLPLTAAGVENPATMTVAPEGTRLFKTGYNNFAPRFGIAYQLIDTPGRETVVRGGIGVFYDLATGAGANGYFVSPYTTGFKSTVNVPYPTTGDAVRPRPFGLVFPVPALLAYDPELTLPRTYQWNLAIERSLGPNQTISASYVAAVGRKLMSLEILRNPNPSISQLSLYSNRATSDYHAMQLQFQRRLKRGLQVLANYAWSKSIDLISSEGNISLERGPSDFDLRHNFSAAATYNLPYPKLNRFSTAILRDWALDGIVRYQTATPINVFAVSLIGIGGQSQQQRPDLTLGIPLYISDPTVPGGWKLNNTVDPSRPGCKGPFCTPPNTRQGGLGRNALRAFPLNQVDLSLRRQFIFTERWKLQLRADVFNILNHPNFADPINLLTSANFGLSTSMYGNVAGAGTGGAGLNPLYQIGTARSIQLSFKVLF